jgi:hypothetical protein
MRKIVDVVPNMKFNRLTAIEYVGKQNNQAMWKFKCDCGKEVIIERYSVVSGRTKSCGCYCREVLKTGDIRRDHGMCNTRIYKRWTAMKRRCNAPEGTKDFEWYGKRGITYCEEWNTFKPFYEWSLANGYADNLSLDRIDNSKGYSPNNCRWVDMEVQQNNRRTNHRVAINGETHTIAEWARIKNVRVGTIRHRLWKGMDEVEAITKPIRNRKETEWQN